MLPLMRMTWVINRRLFLGFSPVLLLYMTMLVNTQRMVEVMPRPFLAVFMGVMGLITLIVTFQGLTLDVEGFLLALPVTRTQVVRNKYLTSLLGLMAGVALPMATAWTAHALAPGHLPAPTPEVMGFVGLWALSLALGIFLFLPFIHHFGPSKGFLHFSLTAILVPAAGLAWKGLDGAEKVITFVKGLPDHGPLALAITVGVLILGLASLTLSTRSYARRAF